MTRIRNFAKTWDFTPSHVHQPSSAAELAQIVRESRTVRVMGARHSWSRGIVTDDALVCLDAMKRVLHVDPEALTVRVEAGIRLHQLIAELEPHGLALANLGSIDTQSLAGAVATGTHGTGLAHRCLADQVQALTLIDGFAQTRHIDRSHPDFDAVAVGLGGFGIVFEMTLSVVPMFQMHAITELMSFDELIDNFGDLVATHDHFKLWWFVPNDEVIVFRQDHTQEPRNDSDFRRWFKDEFLAVLIYRPILALQRIWRNPLVRWTNHLLAGAYAKRHERICKSQVAFLTPEPPVHRETEWAFDYANAAQLLREYRAYMLDSEHSYNFVQEIRVTGADSFWASPSYGRDSLWLSMYNIDRGDRWSDQLTHFEAFARQHDGRPHWGKEASWDPAYLHAHYPKLAALAELRRRYDPHEKFANAWIRRIFDADDSALG